MSIISPSARNLVNHTTGRQCVILRAALKSSASGKSRQGIVASGMIICWSDHRPLYFAVEGEFIHHNIKVKDAYKNEQWDWSCLWNHLPETIQTSLMNTSMHLNQEGADRPIWTLEEFGKFNVSSAWNIARNEPGYRNG